MATIDTMTPNEAWETYVGMSNITVVVETMPEHLRASHRAAGNWGTYPVNGAVRRRVPLEEAEELSLDEEYDHIVEGTAREESTDDPDLDVTPLSVGFDLRVQHMAVVLPPDARSVRYDEHGDTATVTGTTEELTACLEAAGYEVVAQGSEGEEHPDLATIEKLSPQVAALAAILELVR